MNVSQLLTDATLAFRAGRLDESRQLLEDVLAVDHDNQSSLWGLFRICEAQGDKAAAIEFLHRLAAVLPDDISILEAIRHNNLTA